MDGRRSPVVVSVTNIQNPAYRSSQSFLNPNYLATGDEPQPPSYSSIFQVVAETSDEQSSKPPEQQYDPIRYEDYMCFASVVDGGGGGASLNLSPSCRFLFQNAPDQATVPDYRRVNEESTTNPLEFTSSSQQFNQIREMRVKKYFAEMYPRDYLFRHCVFVTVGSLSLIAFQILLMSYASILSHVASGIWCGVINLLTLFFTLITLKFCKLFLLIALIVNHFLCIMVNLGALVIVNCVAATRYNTCSYYASEFSQLSGGGHHGPSSLQFNDRTYCQHYTNNVKYINVAIIVLGAACLFLFINFFFKLISIFNNVHSNRSGGD